MTGAAEVYCKACSVPSRESQLIEGRCPNCDAAMVDADGLYDFRDGETDYYFADVPRSAIGELLRIQQEQGWREAVRFADKEYGQEKPYLAPLMVDSRRASWVYLTHPAAFENALEIGCGWGGSVPLLTSQFDHVFAVDLTRERIRFAQKRCQEMGITNASFGIGFDSLPLPFASDSFDLIAMSGVLAYVPEIIDGDPRRAQLEFLREVCRMIRPGGSIFVGSQNRFGWPYLRGYRDHFGLKWTSLLPRSMANLYSKIRTGRGYRTPTYTANGYKQLFQEAGFQEIEVYWPHHDHTFFRLITSLDKKGTRFILTTSNKGSKGPAKKKMIARLANDIGMFIPFVPSFAIVGHK